MPTESWGLDIGQSAIHAVKVTRLKGGAAEISDAFFYPLDSEPEDPSYDDKVLDALQVFAKEKRVGATPVIVSLPGFTTLFREFPLPGSSASKLDEIVGFQAKQLIPYPLDEVIYDYHRLRVEEDSGEISIALVCCRKDIIERTLEALDEVHLNVDGLQVSPVALVNYLTYDLEPEEPTLILDTGARGTDFVVINDGSFWLRSIGISGTDLTKALMNKFSIPFEKAEELKATMGDSKQGDRVFRVMEPILTNLCGEVQRSVGYYRSLFRGINLSEIVCAGNTYMLSGVDQFIADNVGLPTRTLDMPESIVVARHISSVVEENLQVIGVATGLALQGVGLAEIETTLLPHERMVKKMVAAKFNYAAIAVAMLFLWFLVGVFTTGGQKELYGEVADKAVALADKAGVQTKKYRDIIAEFPKRKQDNSALAQVPKTRGMIQQATAGLLAMIAQWNKDQYQKLADSGELSRRQLVEGEEGRALLQDILTANITAEWKDDKDAISQVKDKIFRYLIWKNSRLYRVAVNSMDARFVPLYRWKLKKGGEYGKWSFNKPAIAERELKNYDFDEEKAVKVSFTGYFVVPKATGNFVTRTADTEELNRLFARLRGLKGVVADGVLDTASFTTEIRKTQAESNLIMLPEITPPPSKTDLEAITRQNEVNFVSYRESVFNIANVTFYYLPQ